MKPLVWDWPAIKAEIQRRGSTLTELALENGLPENACRMVKHYPNRRVQAIIAAFIDDEPENVWPDRYSKKRKPRILSSRYRALLESKKSNASINMSEAA